MPLMCHAYYASYVWYTSRSVYTRKISPNIIRFLPWASLLRCFRSSELLTKEPNLMLLRILLWFLCKLIQSLVWIHARIFIVHQRYQYDHLPITAVCRVLRNKNMGNVVYRSSRNKNWCCGAKRCTKITFLWLENTYFSYLVKWAAKSAEKICNMIRW